MDAKEVMKIQALLEPVVGALQQVSLVRHPLRARYKWRKKRIGRYPCSILCFAFLNILQVVVGILEANLLWNTILMDFLGSQHQLSGPVEKLSQSIGQPELDIGVDTLTDFVRFHQVALPK